MLELREVIYIKKPLFSCKANTHLSSDNLPGDGHLEKLGPDTANVPVLP